MQHLIFISIFTILISVLAKTNAQDDTLETVKELDVAKYTGRWYQTHASPIVLATFERDGTCITADYGMYNSTTLTVRNSQRMRTPTGDLKDIYGHAYTTAEPGKLIVDLNGGSGPADYWVMKLGPVVNGKYEYSLVGEPRLLFLFVLCRDVETFRKKYEQEALDYVREKGFNTVFNNPIETYHGNDCLYTKPN